jgi:hypothetical protein
VRGSEQGRGRKTARRSVFGGSSGCTSAPPPPPSETDHGRIFCEHPLFKFIWSIHRLETSNSQKKLYVHKFSFSRKVWRRGMEVPSAMSFCGMCDGGVCTVFARARCRTRFRCSQVNHVCVGSRVGIFCLLCRSDNSILAPSPISVGVHTRAHCIFQG